MWELEKRGPNSYYCVYVEYGPSYQVRFGAVDSKTFITAREAYARKQELNFKAN